MRAEWVDYNGHMSEWCYLLAFGDNADAFFRLIGIDEQYRADGHSLYTAETHLHHRHEANAGEPLACTLQLLDHDSRAVHIFHEMIQPATGTLLASAEQLLVHVDMAAGRVTSMPDSLIDRLDLIKQAHAALPKPAVVGRPMGVRRR